MHPTDPQRMQRTTPPAQPRGVRQQGEYTAMRDYEQYEDEDGRPHRRRVRPVEVEYYAPPTPRRNEGGSVFYGLLCGFLLCAAFVGFALVAWQRFGTNTAQAQEIIESTPTALVIELTATPSATVAPQPTTIPTATPVPLPTARPAPPVQAAPPVEVVQPVDPTVCAITDDVPQSNVCGPRSQAETLKAQSMMIANQVLGGNIVTVVTQVPTR